MMAGLFSWFAAKGVPDWVVKAGAIVLACAMIALAFRVAVRSHDAGVERRHESTVQLDVQTKARAADQSLSNRAAARRVAETKARQEFDNAAATIPREGLSRRDRLAVCFELRDAGTDTTLIPQCRDVPAGTQAGAGHRHPDQR